MTPPVSWPPALAGTPAVAVIEKAIAKGRLPHGILLAGDSPEVLSSAALAIADRILNKGAQPGQHHAPERHPDCFQVRPAGKARMITIGAIRDLVARINVAPSVSQSRVAILHDADRMNAASSNAFLKALEEPPPDTTLLLLSGRPHSLLPTIRSRVLHFRLPSLSEAIGVEGWDAWIADYRAWLVRLGKGVAAGKAAAESLMAVYGLLARFGMAIDKASSGEVERRKAGLPEDIGDDELVAIEAEVAVGLRARMFAAIAEATRQHYRALQEAGSQESPRLMAAAIDGLERSGRLLRFNLNESAALEDFLLASLRIWTRR
jgi:DNA polymerase-3 subunit delta'